MRCFVVALAFAGVLAAQTREQIGLPPTAVVIERAKIPSKVHRNRELVLWMVSPVRHDREAGEGYSCPEMTLGSYYSGPTRISLIDSAASRVINTIELRHMDSRDDSFDVPYRIIAGYYYHVPGVNRDSEGKPALLSLRDLNGDGLPLETAFFEAEACMGLETTMIGYSLKRDKVIQYPVELKSGSDAPQTAIWVDYLFSEKPVRPGHWSFSIDYRGRGGGLDKYEVHYDRKQEKFVGTLQSTPPPDFK